MVIRTALNLRTRVQNERYLPGVQLALLFLTMHLISLMHILFHFLLNFYTKMSHTTLNSRTTKRVQTFYDGQPTSPPGVCHIPMAEPFCNKTREVSDISQLSVSPTHFCSSYLILFTFFIPPLVGSPGGCPGTRCEVSYSRDNGDHRGSSFLLSGREPYVQTVGC